METTHTPRPSSCAQRKQEKVDRSAQPGKREHDNMKSIGTRQLLWCQPIISYYNINMLAW